MKTAKRHQFMPSKDPNVVVKTVVLFNNRNSSITKLILFYILMTDKRVYHRFPMQAEKFQPEGERKMPETRFTEFSALSVDQGLE